MIAEFKLPDLGEGLTESEIVSWAVSVGDTVTLNQVLGEVETAKAVVELPSPYAGKVTAIAHGPGTVVEVGEVIIAFDIPGTGGPEVGASQAGAEGETAKRIPTLVGYGADPEPSGRPVRRTRVAAGAGPVAPTAALATPTVAAVATTTVVQAERPRSTPPVRKLARDLGIELALVPGSGERGLITRDDVLSYSSGSAGGQAAAGAAGNQAQGAVTAGEGAASNVSVTRSWGQGNEREVRTPVKGVQKFMAQAMVQSAFTAPHVTEFLTVDVTRGMKFLERLRKRRDFDGVKLTPLTLAARAVALGLERHPALNSSWDEAAQEVVQHNYLNLGIAAATPRGLVVPNIKDAHTLGLRALAAALGGLAETARSGKTPPADLAGGTFSITNIGVFGIDAGTPILNTGEAGILALGAVRSTPWEHKGRVALRQVMTLSLSFDHRLVDGAAGSKFLADVGAVMADPAMVLALD
ncbi:dihydrolipoamide acetyltransferase family protein [Arthrobacter sp. HY1533]|uniref:dihydrolipoamide acetyltransferase family protein n=1 Tax=Arthrobacter sp. HY1533 TaxID=2970919 RepID=UPI0022B9F161|nr:dihydrolipoamide acetyltransferase family protein [Arthrobacter sp. HY1533]